MSKHNKPVVQERPKVEFLGDLKIAEAKGKDNVIPILRIVLRVLGADQKGDQ